MDYLILIISTLYIIYFFLQKSKTKVLSFYKIVISVTHFIYLSIVLTVLLVNVLENYHYLVSESIQEVLYLLFISYTMIIGFAFWPLIVIGTLGSFIWLVINKLSKETGYYKKNKEIIFNDDEEKV